MKRSLTVFIKVYIGFFNFHVFPEIASFQAEGEKKLFIFISIAADLVVGGTVDLHQFMVTQHVTSYERGVFNAIWEFG